MQIQSLARILGRILTVFSLIERESWEDPFYAPEEGSSVNIH